MSYSYIPAISKLDLEGSMITLSDPIRRSFGHQTEVIVIDQKLGYIPIPKNGSSSIRKMLKDYNIPHLSIYDANNNPAKFFKQFNIPIFTILRRDAEQRLVSGIQEYLTRSDMMFNDSLVKNLPLDEHTAYQASYLIGVDLAKLDVFTLDNLPRLEKYLGQFIQPVTIPVKNESAVNDIQSLRQRIIGLTDFKFYLTGEQSTVDRIIQFKLKK